MSLFFTQRFIFSNRVFIWDLGSGIPGSGIWQSGIPGSGIRDPGSGIRDPGSGSQAEMKRIACFLNISLKMHRAFLSLKMNWPLATFGQ